MRAPLTVFSYSDGLCRKRLRAALTRGLRDLFGARSCGRTDAEGTFHTIRNGDNSEVAAVDTH